MATVVESSRSLTSVPRNNTNSGSSSGPKNDLEAQQTTACSEETSQSSSLRVISGDSSLQDNSNISLIKEHLVLKEKWITLPRFQRVFAVYQILPGPEAAELCMFFGCLSAGRLGGIVAGLAFILPGFLLMLLASYLYSLAGLENIYFNASFRAIQPIVSAMLSNFLDPKTLLADNDFISLGVYGVIYSFISRGRRIIALCIFILQYVVYTIYVVFRGVPSPVSLALGIAKAPSLPNLFALGLVAGSLSFGGAYTAIPFIQVEAVLKGGWLPPRVFLDGIAIGNILPAPLVIFATFVGFQGELADGNLGIAFAGAVVITIGMFFLCFLFTIAGHDLLEKLVRNEFLAAFFDGLCGAVIGVIAIIALQTLHSSLEVSGSMAAAAALTQNVINAESASASVLYVVALAVLYKFTNKYTPLLLVAVGAIAGQFLFVGEAG
ncbi:chromate transporter-domain-containing protein [Aspergillus floccosus]